jgi:hypothetical protein
VYQDHSEAPGSFVQLFSGEPMKVRDLSPCVEPLEHRLLLSTLSHARLLGGSGDEAVRDAQFAGGYLYVSGVSDSASFLGDAGSDSDMFVAKLDPNGQDPANCPGSVCWSTRIVAAGDDQQRAIAVGAGGSVYALRLATSTSQLFVHKLDAAGNPIFAQLIGQVSASTNLDLADLTLDGLGNLYVSGKAPDANFFGGEEIAPFHGGPADIFAAKYQDTGTGLALIYGTFVGGSGNDEVRRIATHTAADGSSSLYIVGRTASSNFSVPGGFDTSLRGTWDGYLVQLDASGAVAYGTFLGGQEKSGLFEMATGVAVNPAGIVYVAGTTGGSTDFPTTAGAYDRTANGGGDVFLARVNPSASGAASLLYSTYFGGKGDEPTHSIELDAAGDAYIVGRTFSTNLPITADAFQRSRKGKDDAFLARFRLAGAGTADLISSTYLGGTKHDAAQALAVHTNPDGSVIAYAGGFTGSSDFPRTTGPGYAGGADDGFVTAIFFPASFAPVNAEATQPVSAADGDEGPLDAGGDDDLLA